MDDYENGNRKAADQRDESEDFDQALLSLVDDLTGSQLLSIPGIYEILSEHFHNDVLDTVRSTDTAG